MNTLIFGGGELAGVYAHAGDRIVSKTDCDLTDYLHVADWMDAERPERVLCTAGLSDLVVGVTMREVIEANLLGPMNVGALAHAFHVPCVLIASTAGIVPGEHKWYGPAKAGVINFVRSMATQGAAIWAVSPGRMDTAMREADFPGEDRRTRTSPYVVASVIDEIFNGDYAPGANVIVRSVGYNRVDIYEEVTPCLPSLL